VVHESVAELIRRYLRNLEAEGIHATSGIVFGSVARGEAREWSDIDLVVLSPRFDGPFDLRDVEALWIVAGRTDSRIEPIPCGERQWLEDDESTIIEVARRDGQRIGLAEAGAD
jgi:predicted nucleotidyltransferase